MRGRGGCWPTGDQELLLRAALLSGDAARSAWESWQARGTGFDDLDQGSIRLLPLLSASLKSLGVTHDRTHLLTGICRKAWFQNQLLMHDLAVLLRALHAAGLRTMILKGAALVRTVYPEPALRPMGDVDLLIPTEDAARAVEVLRQADLVPGHPVTPERIRRVHSVGFVSPAGREIDLHWHVVEEDCRPGADGEFWARAVPVEVEGVPTLALDPTDQLFHACVHGVRWQPAPPLRWVADAALLARSGSVHWDRMVSLGERHRLVLQLRAALEYLRALLGVEVPAQVVEQLAALPVPGWQRREYLLKTRPDRSLRRLRFHWYNHRRQCGETRPLRRLGSFPDYLLGRWGLTSFTEVPGFVLRELSRRRAQSG